MRNLTKAQRNCVCAVVFLLLTGWAVKAYRANYPSPGNPGVLPAQTVPVQGY